MIISYPFLLKRVSDNQKPIKKQSCDYRNSAILYFYIIKQSYNALKGVSAFYSVNLLFKLPQIKEIPMFDGIFLADI